MFYSPKLFVRDYWIAVPLLTATLAVIFSFYYIIAHIHPISEQIFLHYSAIFGIDLIGPWWQIYYLPVIASIVFLVNFLAGLWFYRSDKFLGRLLCVCAGIVEIFLAIATYLIVGLNI